MTNLSKYANKVYKIIGAAMTVHSELGYGSLEPIDESDYSYLLNADEEQENL